MKPLLLLTIDLETTLNGNDDVGLGHPMHPENHWVVMGSRYSDNDAGDVDVISYEDYIDNEGGFGSTDFVVGHNLAFDLLYLYRHPSLKNTLQKSRLWDTQLAEYILTGQQSKWASLDELSIKYGLPVKADTIKAYFEKGIGSDKIPRDELIPYLKQDVLNTEAIAFKQIEQAVTNNQLDLIISQMEALHATTEMMFNGLAVSRDALVVHTNHVADEYTGTVLSLTIALGEDGFDINSSQQWSKYFFGGTKKVKSREAIGVYKNGNTKYKTVETEVPVTGVVDFTPPTEWISEKTKAVSVDDETLNHIIIHSKKPDVRMKADLLLKYRNISKQLSTYVQGLGKHIMPNGFIHGGLNHTATVTGRLSSTRPNLQNISNNPIKSIFISRYGSEGSLLEFDFSQLEVVGLAHITKDKQLCKDIEGGADIHSELYNQMYGRFPTKEERKPFKSLTFGLIYGAGAKTLATNAKCSVEDAKKFIDTFYNRYPSVKKWHSAIAELADDGARYARNKDTGEKNLFRTFELMTETGRKFIFNEYKSTYSFSHRAYSFSPTELKNYPVQGLATGDIVPLMLGILYRKFVNRSGVKIVNTIHDSVMFDVEDVHKEETIKEVTSVLNNTHKYFEETFGKPLSLKLSAGASEGKNWFNMKERI